MCCGKCGNSFQDNEKFCSKCGNPRMISDSNNNSDVSNLNNNSNISDKNINSNFSNANYNSVNSYSNNGSVITNNNFNNVGNFNNSFRYSNSSMNWNSGTSSNNTFTKDGSEYDEFTNDNLKVQEMKQAFENGPFKGDNKLEFLSFRTCLNSTIEIANTYKDYANYFVASEEVTVGSKLDSAIRFLNQVTPNDSAIDYGKEQIKVYQEIVTKICNLQGRKSGEENFCVNSTYFLALCMTLLIDRD